MGNRPEIFFSLNCVETPLACLHVIDGYSTSYLTLKPSECRPRYLIWKFIIPFFFSDLYAQKVITGFFPRIDSRPQIRDIYQDLLKNKLRSNSISYSIKRGIKLNRVNSTQGEFGCDLRGKCNVTRLAAEANANYYFSPIRGK